MIVFKVFYQDFYQIYLIVTETFIMFWNQTFTWVFFIGGMGYVVYSSCCFLRKLKTKTLQELSYFVM